MIKIKSYTGKDLTDVEDDTKALINSVLWERDIVMLLGTEKAGKSILAQQIGFSLASGQAFLSKYTVPKPVSVLYVQTEGKNAEMARRIKCMEMALENNRDNFTRFYKKFLPLDVEDFRNALLSKIREMEYPPKVMILDSLYTSMVGDLTSNRDVRHFLGELSMINDIFDMATVIIHHEVKEGFERGDDGKMTKVNQGDKRSYGSVFLRAFVEHILYLNNTGKPRDKQRELRCDTTRTGKVIERETLYLVEPEPLYFEAVADTTKEQGTLEAILRDRDITDLEDISKKYDVPVGVLEKGLRDMISKGTVIKEKNRWRWKG